VNRTAGAQLHFFSWENTIALQMFAVAVCSTPSIPKKISQIRLYDFSL
jgi:hypothetical protein